jgi:hypothetical protein
MSGQDGTADDYHATQSSKLRRSGMMGCGHDSRFTLLLTVMGWMAGAQAAPPLNFAPPAFLEGPALTAAASGTTYSFKGRPPHEHASLRITWVELPSDVPSPDDPTCGKAFLEEIRRQVPDAFWQSSSSLEVGALRLHAWRWAGDLGARARTGIVGCAAGPARVFSIAMEDSLHASRESFPAMRAALRTLNAEPEDRSP